MDMEDDAAFDSGEQAPELAHIARSAAQLAAWRRIEEERERRQLKKALEDFDDYVV